MSRLLFLQPFDRLAKRHSWIGRALRAVEASAVYALVGLLRCLSPRRASRVGRGLLARLGPLAERRVGHIVDNLERVYPELPPAEHRALAHRTLANLGAVLGEYPHLAAIADGRRGAALELVGAEHLAPYVRGERQAIFVGAHLSNWELMALSVAREGVPLMVIYRPLRNPHLQRLMARARGHLGCETVSRDEFIRPVVRHLRGGGSLGVLADVRTKGGVEVPFFGCAMPTTFTPARLALRHGCDIVTGRAERTGDARFRVRVDAPLRTDDMDGTGDDTCRALTLAIHQRLEHHIRERPGEWMCTNRRWADRAADSHP